MSNPPVQYKVFVRVPFTRGQFVDPPDPRWNSAKDKELWRILSSTSKGVDIDWNGLTDRFEVTLPFLLQQAAYLYDRQLSQVREQLRRVKPSGTPSAAPSPTPPLDSASASAVGGQPMRRLGSAASAARVSSNLSIKPRTSIDGPREASAVASPAQERATRGKTQHRVSGTKSTDAQQPVPYSRQTSANTVMQTQQRPVFTSATVQAAAAAAAATTAGTHGMAQPTNASVIRRAKQPAAITSTGTSPKASPSPSASSSSDEEGAAGGLGQSRAFARRPQFSRIINKGKGKAGRLPSVASEDASDASDDSDEFLPFASTTPSKPTGTQPARRGPLNPNLAIRPGTATQVGRSGEPAEPKTPRAEYRSMGRRATASALSSSPDPSESTSMSQRSMSNLMADRDEAASSHRSPLNALSPKQRRSVVARDGGSDTGTPSMGSSFSDLDDASVNTSAMEEALANQMRAGGLGAASALRSSLAMGGRLGGLWRGGQGN